MTSLRIKHPILRLDVVGVDGTLVSEHVVFCQQQRQTVHVEECCACVHCDAIAEGEPPTVDCSTAAPPAELPPDRDGESTAVGSMLCRGTVVVAQSVSLIRALALVHDDDRRSLAIVDDAHVMVGVVHDGAAGRSRQPHAASVGAAMTAVIAIDERTPCASRSASSPRAICARRRWSPAAASRSASSPTSTGSAGSPARAADVRQRTVSPRY